MTDQDKVRLTLYDLKRSIESFINMSDSLRISIDIEADRTRHIDKKDSRHNFNVKYQSINLSAIDQKITYACDSVLNVLKTLKELQ